MSDSFFDIRNCEALYAAPPEADPVAWDDYISTQHDAEAFNRTPCTPLQLDIEPNGSCNMACPFCIHADGNARTKSNLTWNQYTKLIDEAAANGTRSLKLNYINEPLIRPDLENAISYAKQAGILNIYFVTNGLLLNKTRRASLLQSGVTK